MDMGSMEFVQSLIIFRQHNYHYGNAVLCEKRILDSDVFLNADSEYLGVWTTLNYYIVKTFIYSAYTF